MLHIAQAQPAPAPPAPPAPPLPPLPPTDIGNNVVVEVPSRPLTPVEIEAIRERRSELSSQLISASGRRKELAEELRDAVGDVDRAGIEDRIEVLDQRIVQLETDIAVTGRMLTTGLTLGETTTEVAAVPFRLGSDQVTGISIVFIIAVLGPLAMATARRIWRRAPSGPGVGEMREISQKLEGLQQAVDTVAIEIERVSEGQRFVTRIMTENPNDKVLNAGTRAAEPLRIPGRDALGARRGEP